MRHVTLTAITETTLPKIAAMAVFYPPTRPAVQDWYDYTSDGYKFLQSYWNCMCYLSEYSKNGHSDGCNEKFR